MNGPSSDRGEGSTTGDCSAHATGLTRGPVGWLAWRPLLIVSAGIAAGVALSDLVPKTATAALLLGLAALAAAALSWLAREPAASMALVVASALSGACWGTARLVRGPYDISRYAPSKPSAIAAVVGYKSIGGNWAVCRAIDVTYSDGVRRPASGWFLLATRRSWELPT
ncbi:MAG: hypothetical protein H5T86_13640, partial [Armatimonadetes bacterium]|nr:hypothetical protein [Armatimonadota bacterium]